MSNNVKESEEDVTEVHDIFDDNQNNIRNPKKSTIGSPPDSSTQNEKEITGTINEVDNRNGGSDRQTNEHQGEEQKKLNSSSISSDDSKFYAIRITGGQEHIVANILQNKINAKKIGIYSILLLDSFKGYIIVEAPDANVAFQALTGIRHIRGQIR